MIGGLAGAMVQPRFSAVKKSDGGELCDAESNVNLSFPGGDGSESNPYQITNWTHLDDVRNNLYANYTLINDLTNKTDGYEEVVNTSNGFEGIGNSSSFNG
ncbi:MAG: hypothetical protein V5A88_10060, partial [Candidatus Thermoplasmatota archaeon]